MTKRTHQFDYTLAITVAVLVVLGILVLASVSSIFSQEKFGNTTYYLFHQIIYGLGFGILLGFIAFKLPLTFFKKWAWILILINLIFMVLVFVPKLGLVSGGAHRWMNLGIITFQPSEFLKLTFIIYLSAWLASRIEKRPSEKNEKNWKFAPLEIIGLKRKHKANKSLTGPTLVPFLIIIGAIALLLTFQSDISTLGLIIFIAALMYFLANTPFWHSIFIFSIGIGAFLALIGLASYRIQRILVFLGLENDPMGIGYQIKQALITVGSGGVTGLGLGMSNQKFGFLPQSMSDSIFAIFAEEAGFIGCLVLICLFLIFLWRGFKICKNSKDRFSQLLALGISCWICLQAFINIGAMIGLLPLTGIPLPFISYGGSHMVAELIGVGILLNISRKK